MSDLFDRIVVFSETKHGWIVPIVFWGVIIFTVFPLLGKIGEERHKVKRFVGDVGIPTFVGTEREYEQFLKYNAINNYNQGK